MRIEDFKGTPAGYLAPTENNQLAFIPNPLPPREIAYERLMMGIAKTQTAIGRLDGMGHKFRNPYLLVRPLQRKEALASSNIEGTYTTMEDLYLLELGADEKKRPPDTREVLNYVRALDYSIKTLEAVPIGTRLFKEMHRIMLHGVKADRGGTVEAGEYKRLQNYVGGRPPNARYVPAPPGETHRLMGELETFINSSHSVEIPPAVFAGFVHYQFETIHPFADGNGRVGRLLIPLLLLQTKSLSIPILYASPAIEERKDEYVSALYNVSAKGDWLTWIAFFLEVVQDSCERTARLLTDLDALREEYLQRIQIARASALLPRIVEFLFESPYLSAPQIAQKLLITYPAASKNIAKLVDSGIIEEMQEFRMPTFYRARGVLEVLNRS